MKNKEIETKIKHLYKGLIGLMIFVMIICVFIIASKAYDDYYIKDLQKQIDHLEYEIVRVELEIFHLKNPSYDYTWSIWATESAEYTSEERGNYTVYQLDKQNEGEGK